eukprot:scaffold28947_cov48-Attheya_sp.AAC.3
MYSDDDSYFRTNVYARQSSGYQVIASEAPSKHQGGIAVFWRDSPHWQIEAYQAFGPNVVSFQLTTGRRERWYVVGAYIPPHDTAALEYVSKALEARPEGVDPILIGDLNANLADPVSARAGKILTPLQLMDWRTCLAISGSAVPTGMATPGAPRYNSDHYMILGTIRSAKMKQIVRLRSCGARIQVSRRASSWISDESWKLIDTRLAFRRAFGHDQAAIRRLTRQIQASLQADRKIRVEKAGDNVEALLQKEPPDLQGAWNALKGWYRVVGDRAPPPSWDTLEKVTAEREDLYRKETPLGCQSQSWLSWREIRHKGRAPERMAGESAFGIGRQFKLA